MIKAVRYNEDKKQEWDEFVDSSDIPIFMFHRNYIEYHKDRFPDHSLIIQNKKEIIALLPGHINESEFYSHQGLTFGGLILKRNTGFETIQEILNTIGEYLVKLNISKILIKSQPSFYSETYSNSQNYLLQSNLKTFSDIKLSTCIYTRNHKFPKSSIEKRKLKLDQFDLTISEDFESFWKILEGNLAKFHQTKPVHSLKEILYLQKQFPDGIKLFVAKNKQTKEIDAGAVLYKFKNILKLQYLAASSNGRTNRASHALYYGFISKFLNEVDYIDLGNCMDDVDIINYNLLYIKERFGASVYPMYSYEFSPSLEL